MGKTELALIERALEAALAKLSTDNQRAFVREYPLDLNLTKAAERAGYSSKSARQEGSRLLSNAAIEEAIALAMQLRSERTQISADRVLEELALIAFSRMKKFAEWGPNGVDLLDSEDLSDEDDACVLEVSETTTEGGGSKRIKLHDKKGALELLGRHLKMWGSDAINLNVLQLMPDSELTDAIQKFLVKPSDGPDPPQPKPKDGTARPPRGARAPKKA